MKDVCTHPSRQVAEAERAPCPPNHPIRKKRKGVGEVRAEVHAHPNLVGPKPPAA